ncbi:MAG: pantoate--beta-alanine ligase [Planctomycetota bacterium]
MLVIETVDEMRAWRGTVSGRVALVPTMGALHAGHLSHLAVGRASADAVTVSIFVNPTQFGPTEDFQRYPRPLEADLAACASAGAAAVFVPGDGEMYPARAPAVEMTVPSVAAGLEGAARPGHFAGVCRVVLKLLNIVQPDAVTFGQKDYQQLCVVRAMIADLMLPTEVLEVPTTREAGGLAMSSRNRYLGEREREQALSLIAALRRAEGMAAEGETDPAAIESAMAAVMQGRGVAVDYAAVRAAGTLLEMERVTSSRAVALVAGRLSTETGEVRLLDNRPLG